jgi:hypothetical protein
MTGWLCGLLALGWLADVALGARIRPAWRVALYAPAGVRLVLPLDVTTPLGVALPLPELAWAPAAPWVVGVWGAGALLLAAHRTLGWLRLRAVLAHATPQPRFEGVGVLTHPTAGPFCAGLLRPRIVLPANLDPALAPAVLAHERMHIRRADPWVAEALAWTRVVLWPLLPIWGMTRRIEHLLEQATDDAVTRGQDFRPYARALVRVAATPAWGPALAASGGLRQRIHALRERRHLPKLAQTALLLALGGVLLAAATRPSDAQVEAPVDTLGAAVLFAEVPADALAGLSFDEPLCQSAESFNDGGSLRFLTQAEVQPFVRSLGDVGAQATGGSTVLLRTGHKAAVASPAGLLGDPGDVVRVSLLGEDERLNIGIELSRLRLGELGLVEQTSVPLDDVAMVAMVLPADPDMAGVQRLVLVYVQREGDLAFALTHALPWQDELAVTPVVLGESERW